MERKSISEFVYCGVLKHQKITILYTAWLPGVSEWVAFRLFSKKELVTFRQDDISFYFPFEIPDFRGQVDGGRRRTPHLEAP